MFYFLIKAPLAIFFQLPVYAGFKEPMHSFLFFSFFLLSGYYLYYGDNFDFYCGFALLGFVLPNPQFRHYLKSLNLTFPVFFIFLYLGYWAFKVFFLALKFPQDAAYHFFLGFSYGCFSCLLAYYIYKYPWTTFYSDSTYRPLRDLSYQVEPGEAVLRNHRVPGIVNPFAQPHAQMQMMTNLSKTRRYQHVAGVTIWYRKNYGFVRFSKKNLFYGVYAIYNIAYNLSTHGCCAVILNTTASPKERKTIIINTKYFRRLDPEKFIFKLFKYISLKDWNGATIVFGDEKIVANVGMRSFIYVIDWSLDDPFVFWINEFRKTPVTLKAVWGDKQKKKPF